mgnify:FL=1
MKTQFEIWLGKVDSERKKRHESGDYYSDYTPLKIKRVLSL